MRVLIVKLSSLGDVVHTMPVVHDIHAAFPDALIDWVVEPGFAPLVRRVRGIHSVIECALRRWRKGWWTRPVRDEWRPSYDDFDSWIAVLRAAAPPPAAPIEDPIGLAATAIAELAAAAGPIELPGGEW